MNKKGNEKDSLQIFLNDVKKNKLLTPAEEEKLAKKIEKGSGLAREKLIEANLRLVIKIAKETIGFNRTDIADRIQDGIGGLMKAVERFDYRRGYKFLTYASWWIKRSIQIALNKPAMVEGGIGIPSRKAELRKKITRFFNEYVIEYGHRPTSNELIDFISEKTGKLKKIGSGEKTRLEKRIKSVVEWPKVVSLDMEVLGKNDESNLVNLIEDEREYYQPEKRVIAEIDAEAKKKFIEECLEKISRVLDPKYEDIIRIRYCLFNGETKAKYDLTDKKIEKMITKDKRGKGLVSHREIGLLMGMKTETVRQRKLKALRFIRATKKNKYY